MAEQRLGEMLAIAANLPPASRTANTYNSTALDMTMFNRAIFDLIIGAMTATATINAKLQCSVDGSTNWEDIPNKAMTQLGDTNSNKMVRFDLQSEDCKTALDQQPRRYARLSVTTAAAAVIFGIVANGDNSRYGPASNYDLADVAQIVP